jgi:hypothetical protein
MGLFSKRERFSEWLEYDDGPKETYLAEVGGSWVSDEIALQRLNVEYAPRDAEGNVVPTYTSATVRQWVGGDEEFSAALKVAIQMRREAERLGTAPGSGPPEPKPLPPGAHPNFVPLDAMPQRDMGRRPVVREGAEPDPYADGTRQPPEPGQSPGTFTSIDQMWAAMGGKRRR